MEAPQATVFAFLNERLSAFLPFGQVTGSYLAGQDVADHPRGHEAGDLRRVVGR